MAHAEDRPRFAAAGDCKLRCGEERPFHLIPGAVPLDKGPDGNSIILDAPDGLIVVDTGRHPEHAQAILDYAKERGRPIAAIVNSHWHLDHTTGNWDLRQAYPQVQVYASDALEGALATYLKRAARTPTRCSPTRRPRHPRRIRSCADEQSSITLSAFAQPCRQRIGRDENRRAKSRRASRQVRRERRRRLALRSEDEARDRRRSRRRHRAVHGYGLRRRLAEGARRNRADTVHDAHPWARAGHDPRGFLRPGRRRSPTSSIAAAPRRQRSSASPGGRRTPPGSSIRPIAIMCTRRPTII